MIKSSRSALLSLVITIIAAPAFAQAPTAPQGLTSTVTGTTVVLTWSAPSSGASSYVVEAALAPGGLAVATLPVQGTTLTVPNVPSGNYYVRVRGISGGVTGAASNEVLVSVGGSGCPAAPLPPSLIVRSVGLQASLAWGPSGGCAPTSYTLFAGSAPGASNIAIVNAGSQLGLATAAPPGIYYVRVVGTNAFGSATSSEMVLQIATNAQTDTVQPNGAVAFDIRVTQSGVYQALLQWNDAAIDLDFYLTAAGCPYPPTGCALAISDAQGTTSESVSRTVNAGDSYRLWVDNFSPRATSFTIFNSLSGNPLPTDQQSDAATIGVQKIKR